MFINIDSLTYEKLAPATLAAIFIQSFAAHTASSESLRQKVL